LRQATALLLVASLAAWWLPSTSHAAAEVHRMNLVVSGIPSSVTGGGLNDAVDTYNQLVLTPKIIKGLEHLDFGWHFDGELRYFVRPNVAINAGAGFLGLNRQGEVFPRLQQNVQFKLEAQTMPIHLGADYYMAPYVQGDFQARAFVGGGLLALVGSKATFTQTESGTDSSTTLGDPRTPPNSFEVQWTNDAPGYYLQGGVHMWFPSRLSVMLAGYYRSAKIRGLVETFSSQTYGTPGGPVTVIQTNGLQPFLVNGKAVDMDMSGLGMRFAVGIGL
jgi:hypothetical protein